MSYTCKELREGNRNFAELRELFITRMTVDSDHNDARRKDFNQAIFFYPDYVVRDPENAIQAFDDMTMDLVLECFDNAVKDWQKRMAKNDNVR